MLPFLVRHSAWQTTHYQVKADGKTPYERLRGRPYGGQVAEFAEVVHFRDLQKAADMPKLDDRWSLGLWLGKSLASDEYYVGTTAGVRRCRTIYLEASRESALEQEGVERDDWRPCKPTPQPKEKPQVPRGVFITLDRQMKYGGTKGCPACFGHPKVHSSESRARFQDIVDNEAAQTAAASASEPNVETPGQAAGGPASSSSSGPAPVAGRPAPEDVSMDVAAESSAAQPTSSAVRTLETEDGGSAKRQRLMASMPILHESDVDVNVDAFKTIVSAAMPDNRGSLTGTRSTMELRAETCLTHRRCMRVGSGSVRTLRSWRWLNPFHCRELELRVRRLSTESGWTMRKGRQKARCGQEQIGCDRSTRTPARM